MRRATQVLHWLLTANVAEKVHDVASNLAFHQHIQDIRVAIMGAAGAKDMLWDGGYSDERNINFLGGDVRASIFFHASHALLNNFWCSLPFLFLSHNTLCL